MKRLILVIIILFMAVFSSMAQDYAVSIKPDKKVIYVDMLNLPDYLSVEEVLQIIPEFVVRGDQLYNNFDVQYDGKSVGESFDALMTQTKLAEIEKIEISTSSVATQQRSEVSGSINFVPKKLKEGFEGKVFVDVTSLPMVLPNVDLNYRKGKIQLYGNANVEGFWPGAVTNFVEETKNLITNGTKKQFQDYYQETARLNLTYDITERDVLKGWFLESWYNLKDIEVSDLLKSWDRSQSMGPGWRYNENVLDTTLTTEKKLVAHVMTQYEHKFRNESKITAFAGYEMNPSTQNSSFSRPRNLDSEIKYEFSLPSKEKHSTDFTTGVNSTLTKTHTIESNGRNIYVSPYLQLKYKSPKWSVDAAVRYQHFERTFSMTGDKTSESIERDVVGDANAVWQFRPHDALRLTAARNLVRPSAEMLYPRLYYSATEAKWFRGNRYLNRAYLHTVELDYIMDRNWSGNNIIFSIGVGYTRADGLIEEVMGQSESNSAIMPEKIYYTTYNNSGINDISTSNFSVIYTRGMLTLAFAGDFFAKNAKGNDIKDYTTYYNLSLTPILNFKHQWTLTGRFIYNSPVNQSSIQYGDCFLAKLRLGKRINNWTIHAEISDIFDYLTTDYMKTEDKSASFAYDLYGRFVQVGFSYKFGRTR